MSQEIATVNNLLSLVNMPKEEVKRAMDKSFLSNLVRNHPTLSQNDFLTFINKCQLTGADPRLNQVYLLVHNAWNAEKRIEEPKGTTVFAYQFFIQLAQRTGQLESFGVDTKEETYLDMSTGQERKSITSTSWAIRKGLKYEYKARFWEFAKTKKDGALMGTWRAAPYLMLEKCAVANVLRWAFPEALTGVYTSEEVTSEPVHIHAIPARLDDKPVAALKPAPEVVKPAETVAAVVADTIEPLVITAVGYAEPVSLPLLDKPEEVIKKEAEIDFGDRDIEDIRGEIIEFIKHADQKMFDKIGKTKTYMLESLDKEKDLESMKFKYKFLMKYL